MRYRSPALRSVFVALCAALFLGAPVAAQDTASVPMSAPSASSEARAAEPAARAGPTLDNASVGVRRPAAVVNVAPPPSPPQGNKRVANALVFGGAAVIVVGAVVEEKSGNRTGQIAGAGICVVGTVLLMAGMLELLR